MEGGAAIGPPSPSAPNLNPRLMPGLDAAAHPATTITERPSPHDASPLESATDACSMQGEPPERQEPPCALPPFKRLRPHLDSAHAWALPAVALGLMSLDRDRATLYGDLVLRAAGELAPKVLEAIMSAPQGYEFQSEFAKRYFSKGREEGREEGRQEGRQVGRKEGEATGMAKAILKVLESRGLSPSVDERDRILATHDLATLENWLLHALKVASAEELLQLSPED